MKAGCLRVAGRLVDAWTRLYTLGLPSEQRRQRRETIRADVYDEAAEAVEGDAKAWSVAWSLVSRCLRGMPEDVTWRLFEARRLPTVMPVFVADRRPSMAERSPGVVFFALAAGIGWVASLVMVLTPVEHSLAFGGGLLTLICLAAWAMEARSALDDEAGASTWPLLVAVGIVAIVGGLVFEGGRAGLVLLVPVSLGFSAGFFRGAWQLRTDREDAGIEPMTASELARHAAAGEAIAIETAPRRGVTRRAVLRGGFSLGIASVLATMGGIVVDFLWQRNVSGFGGVVMAGKVGDFAPGTKTRVLEGKFWLVNLTEAQGGPGFLALWQKCPHLGCVVPWLENFNHLDPATGREREGWFRCPCHQSTYDDAGVRVFGPAPRSMDRMAVQVTEDGYIEVDTGNISKGSEENATFAVPVSRT